MAWKRFKRSDADSLEKRDLALIDWLNPLGRKVLNRYFRATVRGLENIPRGPALYVGNHNMGLMSLDSAVFFSEAYRLHGVDALAYGLAHDWPFVVPGVRNLIMAIGGVRASHENAARVFEAGYKAMVYPGGDVDALRPWRHRNKIIFGGRDGYIKLALSENVPIIPVVAHGAHSAYMVIDDMRWLAKGLRLNKYFRVNVWPLTLSIPWGLTLGPPPPFIPFPSKITMEVLPPLRLDPAGPEVAKDPAYVRRCADKVEGLMQDCLTRLADTA